MEIVQQLQTELNEAKKRKERLSRELSSLSSCIQVFQNEIKLRRN